MAKALSQSEWYYTFGRRIPALTLLLLVSLINGLGLVVLFSIGRADESGLGGYFFRQCLWLVIGLTAFGVSLLIDWERHRKQIWLIVLVAMGLLCLVLVPGVGLRINGARRWLSLGLMNMQVSDFARVAYILMMAAYLSSTQRDRRHWFKGFVLPVALIGTFAALLMKQPDYGTAFLFAAVGLLLMYLAGASILYLGSVAGLGIAGFSLLVAMDPVRLERIVSFLDVEAHRADGAYQLWQGIIGFGVGGVNGVGLGNGRQQFAFLPEAHTDFIFPIIGEELGLLATFGVVFVFLTAFLVVWGQLRKAPNQFQFILVAGALFFILFQALINMGVATGCLPTKGMSLPFVSYGGSNIVVNYFLLGIIIRGVWTWNNPPEFKPREID